MTSKQLYELSIELIKRDYPNAPMYDYKNECCWIECHREIIPSDVVELLSNAPDFSGVMAWGKHRMIIFAYKVTL